MVTLHLGEECGSWVAGMTVVLEAREDLLDELDSVIIARYVESHLEARAGAPAINHGAKVFWPGSDENLSLHRSQNGDNVWVRTTNDETFVLFGLAPWESRLQVKMLS